MEQKNKLKPCPWCGETPQVLKPSFIDPPEYGVACLNESCLVTPCTDGFDTAEEAAEAWNSMYEHGTCHIDAIVNPYNQIESYRCSECGAQILLSFDYCCGCGAKVVNDA